MMSFTSRRNFKNNRRLEPEKTEYVCGQSIGNVPKYRYGLFSMEFNGCEIIAVYNALIYLKKPQPLCETAYFMERYRMAMGLFGCNPLSLLRHPLLSKTKSLKLRRTTEIYSEGGYIVSLWLGFPLLSQIHTFFAIIGKDGAVTAYNRFSDCCLPSQYSTISELIYQKHLICIYALR